MRVGIITFHRAINYGGVLQAYALQQYILRTGNACEIIDYRCPFLEAQYGNSRSISLLRVKMIISAILRNGTIKENKNGFQRFCNQYLKMSLPYSEDTISNATSEYDLIITGSDQVWSPTCAGFDINYFLSFVKENKKKVSYAASVGGAIIPKELEEKYSNLLSSFSWISVREDSIRINLAELLHREVFTVADPTFLLTKEDWKSRFYRKLDSNYVLLYMIVEDSQLIEKAINYAKDNNLEVWYINDRLYKTKGVKNLRHIDPDEWVNLFLNAKMVITNSFHGIAFAINFSKPFFAALLKENTNVNARITELLKKFGAESHLLNKGVSATSDKSTDLAISVERQLSELRNESYSYINNVLMDSFKQ